MKNNHIDSYKKMTDWYLEKPVLRFVFYWCKHFLFCSKAFYMIYFEAVECFLQDHNKIERGIWIKLKFVYQCFLSLISFSIFLKRVTLFCYLLLPIVKHSKITFGPWMMSYFNYSVREDKLLGATDLKKHIASF